MTKKIFLFWSLTILLTPGRSIGQVSRNITMSLEKLLQEKSKEKSYLQFDKPYYAAGDTIYFKAYVTAGEQCKLSSISGVLHVDLINTDNKIDQSIKLQLDSGITWGDFALPDSLPAGNYRIRAYTQWMRNDAKNDFFERLIPVGAVKSTKVPKSRVKQSGVSLKPDIQFLPEGGNLINGISTRVAFKATDPIGLGIAVKGIVMDNESQTVATFASAHLGMGEFTFTPTEGKTYSAKIAYANGTEDAVSLPKAESSGISLSVNNDSFAEAAITIAANNDYFQQNKGNPYTLLIYSGGLITTVTCKLDSPLIKLDILKRKLRTGVATITLFSTSNEPLCERLFFVQNYDQLSLNLSTARNVFTTREKVTVKLHAITRKGEPSRANFSASVVNENLLPETDSDVDNISSYFMLTSDLKGYIEQPGYYFSDTSGVARKNLDLLMLTQGYRRFEWKEVLNISQLSFAYQAEKGILVAGQVENLSNKAVVNGTVSLISSRDGRLLTTTTNNKGSYQFPFMFFSDTAHFVITAVNSKGKNTTKILWDNEKTNIPEVEPIRVHFMKQTGDTAMASYIENDQTEQREISNYVSKKPVVLKQVNVHSKKPNNQYRSESLAGAGQADQVMRANEIEQIGGQLETILSGRLHGVKFSSEGFPYLVSPPGNGPMLVVIDGAEYSEYKINNIPATQVETIEVLKYAGTSMYGVKGGSGVLIITTKQTRQLDLKDIASFGVLPITVTGFYKARQFYSPKYDNPALTTKQRDLRSTIYWQPELKTDRDGNASFEYYNADGTGTYKVTIEGIDKDGNIGRQVYRYEVK